MKVILFRVFTVLFALVGLIMLQGLSEGLQPWIQATLVGEALPDEHRFHGAVHGAYIGILFSLGLLPMLSKPLEKPLLLRFYFMGHFIFLGTLVVTDPFLAFRQFIIFILFGIMLAVLYGTYHNRREIFHPTERPTMNRQLFILAGIALVMLTPFIVNGIIGQYEEAELQFRWGEGSALAITLIYGGYLTATGRQGSCSLGVLLGFTYLFLGAASLTVPEHPASWGVWGGIAGVLYGLVYIAVVLSINKAAV